MPSDVLVFPGYFVCLSPLWVRVGVSVLVSVGLCVFVCVFECEPPPPPRIGPSPTPIIDGISEGKMFGWDGGGSLSGGGFDAVARIKSRLGNGGKSVISGCFLIRSERLMLTGGGRVLAPAGTSSICPPRT